ncbi:chloride channel protein CLC-d, partial [Haematococcus lacustris]
MFGVPAGEVKFKSFAGYRCHLPNHYNDLAVLVFNPQGYIIQALFQAHSKTFSFGTMAIYAAAYWFMAAITYGAFIPSGLFLGRPDAYVSGPGSHPDGNDTSTCPAALPHAHLG